MVDNTTYITHRLKRVWFVFTYDIFKDKLLEYEIHHDSIFTFSRTNLHFTKLNQIRKKSQPI